jgi:hypothetical protein
MQSGSGTQSHASGSADARPPLRGWQRRALAKYLTGQARDFLALIDPDYRVFSDKSWTRPSVRRSLEARAQPPTAPGDEAL